MNGTTLVAWVPISGVGSSDWKIGGVADVTGDGKADLVWQNRTTGETGAWIMNGTSLQGWAPMGSTGPGGEWELGGLANMAGDASPDVVWHNRLTGQTGVWAMSGTTIVAWVEMPWVEGAGWQIGDAADVTGDGRPDLVWQNRATRQVAAWVMGGNASGRNSLTTYAYDDRWNLPIRVSSFEVSPGGVATPLSGSSRVEYDARGNRVWQQDGRGETGRVEFFYNAAGQITSSRLPSQRQSGAMRDSIEYDSWGNLSRVRTPGGVWTTTHKDALGRDTLVLSPIDPARGLFQRQRSGYDAMDRVRWTETHAPDTDGRNGAQMVKVETDYDAEGAPWKSRRSMSPDPNGIGLMTTEWRRDAAGRVVTHISGGEWEETAYNPAGQAVSVRPRLIGGIENASGLTIRVRYDALGRVTQRITPPMVYPIEPVSTIMDTRSYPLYPLEPGSVSPGRLPGDTAVFVYDHAGNMVVAANRDAVVTRSYYPNGAIRGDTLAIRTYAGADFTQHVYGLEYTYDIAGRRTRLGYPQAVLGTGAAASYAYNPQSGALETVTAPGAHVFSFGYNADGQLWTLGSPGGITETNTYNAEGQLQQRTVIMSNAYADQPNELPSALRSEIFSYDARGKVVQVSANPGGMTNSYAALGALSHSESITPWSYQTLLADPLGNTVRDDSRVRNDEGMESRTAQTHRYSRNGTGRLLSSLTKDEYGNFQARDTTTYDPAGNRIHYSASSALRREQIDGQNGPATEAITLDENTRSYYDAEGRLRATDRRRCVARPVDGAYRCVGWEAAPGRDPGAFEEYRYDALGRRVLVRTRFEAGQCGVYLEQCRNRVVRTVWEGDQLLLELRSTGDERTLEYDSEWVAYTHGPGIDAPLAVRVNSERVGAARDIIPLANWRGLYDSGVFPNGSTLTEGLDLKQVEWAGRNYRAFFDYVRDEPVWLGSLMTHKRDASGQLYMRNRYFDPTSGRFTQEDPIGIAGGLNLYGFGGADPVTYSDPYGLCPEEKKVAGVCPGGLSDGQWQAVEGAAEKLRDEAKVNVLNFLNDGRIRPADLPSGRAAEAEISASQPFIRVDTNLDGGGSAFDFAPATLAFVLAHEVKHTQQVPQGWARRQIFLFRYGHSKSFRNSLEPPAYQYACEQTTGGHGYAARFCGKD
jgi:RHS repeat-associated protein